MGQVVSSIEDTVRKEADKHKNLHLVVVEGITKLTAGKIESCVSSDFYVGGLKWNIILVPVGNNSISFGLMISDSKCVGSDWKVRCNVKLTLYSQHSSMLNLNETPSVCFDANCKKIDVAFTRIHSYLAHDIAVFSATVTKVKPIGLNVTSIPRTMGTAEKIKLMEVEKNKSKFTWKITHFSSFVGEHHSSYQFTVGPRRWFLRMCPKGTLEGKGNSLSLFLHASDYVTSPNTNTLAVYKLRVLDQIKRNHHEIDQQFWFGSDDHEGEPKFLALDKLHKASNGFLVNDQIYINIEFLYVATSENML
ncbi:unnamed protein product [Eruca vesicaria subsp. sativa]|uniref:MATH domain-containing protein n=1 Tax=Eruca vesicaria subsp. sativa TaxID=29727 RepID=A0ABC8LHV6_ERUVS|nr:unnamed protein product [Eruca vesicaria subsp. sativa]